MARGLARRPTAEQHERLPAPYWTLLTQVRPPGRPDLRIDEVLAGPSGVHVVVNQARRPGTDAPLGPDDSGLEVVAALAVSAATTVADLLDERYRRHAFPAVCLLGTVDLGFGIGDVLVASPDVLRHTWRHRPNVLSTSEATEVAAQLRARLEPFPVETTRPPRRWRRPWRRPLGRVAGAGAAGSVMS